MPFLVSVLEYFFSQSLCNFLKYDEVIRKKINSERIKFDVADVLLIINKQESLEDRVISEYNFQNLNSTNKAYKTYLELDIFKIFDKRKKVNGKIINILAKIQEILEARHKFVHEMDINYDLTKEMYFDYIEIINTALSLILEDFKKRGLKIDNNYF